MTERKLPNPPEHHKDEVMSKEDWDYYFECRKKCDKPMSKEEVSRILSITTSLDSTSMDSPDIDEYVRLIRLIPATPSAALAIKHCQGFKVIQEFNLYEAKLKYPDEF